MLSIKNLVVSLKNEDKKILDGLDLEIKAGEIHAIMGPNGTGKSTLSKAIMGHFLFNVLDDLIKSKSCLISNIARALKNLYRDTNKLARMRANTIDLAKPYSTENICKILMDNLK